MLLCVPASLYGVERGVPFFDAMDGVLQTILRATARGAYRLVPPPPDC